MTVLNFPAGGAWACSNPRSRRICLAAVSLMAAFGFCSAARGAPFTLELEGEAERTRVDYACRGEEDAEPEALTVEYINLPGNTLALLPVDGRPTLFVNVVSASGAKYVAGPMVWWTRGSRGDLYQAMTENASTGIACQVDRSAG